MQQIYIYFLIRTEAKNNSKNIYIKKTFFTWATFDQLDELTDIQDQFHKKCLHILNVVVINAH